jgi:Zn-dependent protease with chaperone function
VLGGVALLVWGKGAGRGVGIALLIVALLVVAIPISPFLRARIRRREARAARPV